VHRVARITWVSPDGILSNDHPTDRTNPTAAEDTLSEQEVQLDQPTEGSLSRRQQLRARIAKRRGANLAYRIVVGVVGSVVLAVGIVTIPYPGPGWLIVFTGLGILASEFEWAHRVLHFARVRYDRFMAWFARQGLVVKAMAVLLTFAVVVATLWVLGTFGLVGGWIGLEQGWLQGPLG